MQEQTNGIYPQKAPYWIKTLYKGSKSNKKPDIYFLNNIIEDVQSFKLPGLTISNDLSWANHISKLASKANRRMGILHCTNSILAQLNSEPPIKAFIHSCLMESFSPLSADSTASHLAHLDAVEIKAFKIIGISRVEAESMDLSLRHRRHVGGLSVFFCFLSGLAPSVLSVLCPPPDFCRAHTVHNQPSSGKNDLNPG